jgi:hypothetical protein
MSDEEIHTSRNACGMQGILPDRTRLQCLVGKAMLQTEFEFTLPCGYVDEHGNLHRHGIMRRATALDEIEPFRDGRVQANEFYLSILMLSRVVLQLGTLASVSPTIIEGLFATDFIYLQTLYARINSAAAEIVETQCPKCGERFQLDLTQRDEPS